jgi:hypothetical protein
MVFITLTLKEDEHGKDLDANSAGILSIVAGAFGLLASLAVGLFVSIFLVTDDYSGIGEEYIASAVVWQLFYR